MAQTLIEADFQRQQDGSGAVQPAQDISAPLPSAAAGPSTSAVAVLLKRVEIDRAVAFGIFDKAWRLVAGPVTALLIAAKFTPQLQGYYYAFASLLALQVFVELGLGTVIIQFASHEWSRLKLDDNGRIVGDPTALSRLKSLARFAAAWYLVGAAVLSLGLAAGGYFFFSQRGDSAVNWVAPWLALSLLTGLTISILPVWSLLEGCNQVANVYTFRFIQGLCIYIAIWVCILSGAKLWAASISSFAALACSFLLLSIRYGSFLKTLLLHKPTGPRIEWRKEVLPMQWRIALSWLSGYFTFSLFTPVLFYYHGPVAAGQMGMTWSLVVVVSALSVAWVNPKAPRFGMLIAQKRYNELDRLFWRLVAIVAVVAACIAVGLWLLVYWLNVLNHPLASRLLPPMPTGLFLLATGCVSALLPMAAYMRAHRKEPLMALSIVSACLMTVSNIILGKYFAALGMAIGYLITNLMLLPFVVMIWYRFRKAYRERNPMVPVPLGMSDSENKSQGVENPAVMFPQG